MTGQTIEKINPLTIAENSTPDDHEEDSVGFAVICNEQGIPILHEIPDHRTPTSTELFNINWFLAGSIVGGIITEPDDSE